MKWRSAAPLMLALLIVGPVRAADAARFVLEGDLSAHYASGSFVVWTPNQPRQGEAATRMGRSAPATAAKPSGIAAARDVIAKAALGDDGTFKVEAEVDAPRLAYFHVLDARSHNGVSLAPVKGNAFILEPGRLRLHMARPGRFHIEGGRYNDAVYNRWRRAAPYIAAQQEYARLIRAADGESETRRRALTDEAAAAFDRMLTLEAGGRQRTATTHPDPLVRRLVLETTWLEGPWMLDAWRGLAALTPADAWVLEHLARAEEDAAARAREPPRFGVGAEVPDFVAETLDGETVRLADVRATSKLVLIEFWASWCGPCRVEIPGMKRAYDRYRDAGFEIVSFTIDDDREDWETASEEEQLPWPNLGMGRDAEAAVAYDVAGIPKNYLVEASTGEVVATDLRGRRLDEKLGDLLN